MIESEGPDLDVASRRPQPRFGFCRRFDRALDISHQVAELQLKDPVEALHDRKAGSQQGRLVADKSITRRVASQSRDEALDRKQDIDDVRVSPFLNERQA